MSKQKIPTCATCIHARFSLSEKTGKPRRGGSGYCTFIPVLPPLPISITGYAFFRAEFPKSAIHPNDTGCPCHEAKEQANG